MSFYGYDGHGNTRFLTDANANVTDTYDYDAFGNLIARTGSTPNLYLFTGEQYDPDLGLYYLRARYHNPSTGRFWSMDSFEGFGSDPMTLHKYTYCGNNPVNCVDPSGNFTLPEFSIAMGIRGAIVGGVFGAIRGYYEGGQAWGWNVVMGGAVGAFAGFFTGGYFGALSPQVLASKEMTRFLAIMTGMGLLNAVNEYRNGQTELAALDAAMVFMPWMLTAMSQVRVMSWRWSPFMGKAELIQELERAGIKHTSDAVIEIAKNSVGRIFFLERGNSTAGFQHIVERHGSEFVAKGIDIKQIPALLIKALTKGRIVGYQGTGTGRPIYEVQFGDKVQRVAITVGDNGFIVGANPTSSQ